MTDNDLILRGDALKTADEELRRYGFSAPEGRRCDMRDAIAALPAVTVGVKPLDLSCVQKHAFLSGVVAARNVPPGDPCSGPLLWLDYDPGDHPALARILAALAVPEVRALEKEVLRLKAALWAIGHAAGIETKEDLMQAALAALRGEGGNG